MENKSQLRPHESDSAKGSSKDNLNHSGSERGNPQRGRSDSSQTQQSSGVKGGERSSKADVETDGGAPSRQTMDAQRNSGQI